MCREKGFVHFFVLLLILAGIGLGFYLVQHQTNFFSKAANPESSLPETSLSLTDSVNTTCDGLLCKVISFREGTPAPIKVDLYARSDIEEANLFSVKISFPADLLQVSSIETNAKKTDPEECQPAPKCPSGSQLITGDPGRDSPSRCPAYSCVPPGGSETCYVCDHGTFREAGNPNDGSCNNVPTCSSPNYPPTSYCKSTTNVSTQKCDVGGALSNSGETNVKRNDILPTFTINNWVENSYDNSSGKISLIAGATSPGIKTLVGKPGLHIATIIFQQLKEGKGTISFDDSSTIYSNANNINILTIKRNLDIDISQNKPSPTFPPVPTASPTIIPDLTCGGFTGKRCPDNYECKLEGNYPDAMGKCVIGKQVIKGSGDGNSDGKVDLVDLSMLLSNFNGKSSFPVNLDINGDGKINSFDFSLIIQMLIENSIIKK